MLLGALVCLSAVAADPQDDPFSPANRAEPPKAAAQAKPDDDPFSPTNKSEPSRAAAPARRTDAVADRIDFEVAVEPKQARRGETVKLTITGKPRPGYHTYPITQRTPDQDESGLSRIKYEPDPALKPLPPLTESKAEPAEIKGVGTFLEFKGPFTWSQDVLVAPEARPGEHALRFRIKLQVCDRTCVWGEPSFEQSVRVTDQEPVPLSADLQARLKAAAPENPGGGEKAAGPAAAPATGLLGLLIASMGAAVAMLFTPCVFPMIPITVSFFLKQSEKQHHSALLTAAVYSVTIVITLALSVLVLGQLIVNLANNAWLNLGLGVLLVYFALSLFGMYEIELPSGLARFTSSHEGAGGYLGAMFMALTFTITSFTCTGPFLGPLLVAVKEYRLSFGERALGALCYAATFAAPFFVMALFPSLVKKLPRSGGWLNAVKVVMGFLEFGAALKFLANTDLAWNPGNPWIFNYETVLCSWIALSLLCGLYLLGVFRLPHDTPLEHLGVMRMLLASIFVGLAIYMVPALWRVTPQGVVGKALVAFLPLDTRLAPIGGQAGSNELAWLRDYEKAWKLATDEGKLIFIDFTGQNCTNCRYNEKNLFPLPDVHRELSKYVRVQLYTDFVPDPALSRTESERAGQRNQELQGATFDDITNPLYAIVKPDRSSPFEDVNGKRKIKGKVEGVRKGLITEDQVQDFVVQFLSKPLQGTTTQTAQAGSLP